MQLPKKITPCPIEQVVVEIRFESVLPPEAIFGVVYNALNSSYPKVEQLPILQIPEFIRTQDPNLIFQPHHRLHRDNYSLQIGPKVLSVVLGKEYSGWNAYKSEIYMVFSKINTLNFISRISRVGIRYIDFFEGDIFKNINVQLSMYGENAVTEQTFVRTLLKRDNFDCHLQVGNNMTVEAANAPARVGSIIDIDMSNTAVGGQTSEQFFQEVDALLEQGHHTQKDLFFNLLKPEFLDTLNPVY
ncbi:MAG: TIGR04255 family protein [Pyrinomonadaceae bacterium]